MPAKTHTMHGRDHCPTGADPIPCLPDFGSYTSTFEQAILAKGPAGLWKLNESSGTTAYDSSGNDNHMLLDSGYLPPTWGQEESPVDPVSALIETGATFADETRVTVDLSEAFADDFSAGIWVKLPTFPLHGAELIGQGTSVHTGPGWSLIWNPANEKLEAWIGSTQLSGDAAIVEDLWYLAGLTVDAGTATLYIDGEPQADTTTDPITGNVEAWIGNDGDATHDLGGDELLSWGWITTEPLSAADWADLYDKAGTVTATAAAGMAWTADGDGGMAWAFPTIEIEF